MAQLVVGLPDSPLTRIAMRCLRLRSRKYHSDMMLTKGANSLELGSSLSMLLPMAMKQTPNLRKRTSCKILSGGNLYRSCSCPLRVPEPLSRPQCRPPAVSTPACRNCRRTIRHRYSGRYWENYAGQRSPPGVFSDLRWKGGTHHEKADRERQTHRPIRKALP